MFKDSDSVAATTCDAAVTEAGKSAKEGRPVEGRQVQEAGGRQDRKVRLSRQGGVFRRMCLGLFYVGMTSSGLHGAAYEVEPIWKKDSPGSNRTQ
eukprot:8192523-Heterocapsa_arctica.AAC.1